jgi:hypothetical protein
MSNSNFENANVNGSVPIVAAESEQQLTDNHEVKLFEVAIAGEVLMFLEGHVKVYAADEDEAVDKVQAQIDAEILDDDFEMEDVDSGYTIPYSDVKHFYNVGLQTDAVGLVEDDVDPLDVLQYEVKELEAQVSWDAGAMAKRKEFLLSLLDEEQSVAA